ncbi:MAG: anaerobic ribonucleoside-triphosphate reductase activating protein [Candidatus Pacebacteria bacterium]|nr:anaerobic ribonucleoside-triphosphate reductase activating protein [Candidatus Paceibacterota bacterium]
MLIGGLQKLTLIDYPSKVAAIIFTIGCNFRCRYCYNTRLVDPKLFREEDVISEEEIFSFLKSRVGKLDAVVVTGGEPTLHKDLDVFISKIKKLSFLVKLDSNGTNPEVLQSLIDKKLVDYIAMDIKNDFENYQKIVNVKLDISKIKESIKVIMNSGIDYEFRTTAAPGVTKEDILNISEYIKGAKKYYLQVFQEMDVIDNSCKKEDRLSEDDLKEIAEKIKNNFLDCNVR